MDCNAKIGPELIRGAKHSTSDNGKLLIDLVERRNLTIVNTLDICQGTVTRKIEDFKKEQNNLMQQRGGPNVFGSRR